MKAQLLIIIMLTAWTNSLAQDGSDILYTKTDQVDESFVGMFVHLDFYRQSFHGIRVDTITISADGNSIRFIEHREDTGFNNWFRRQYLESLEKFDGIRVRVVKSRLDRVTPDSIFVTNFLEYYANGKLLPEKSKEIVSTFPKNIIAEILVSSDSYKENKLR